MGRKKSSVGCLFWIALILLVLVIFLFNRNTIETVLNRTGLMTYLSRRQQQPPEPEVEVVTPETPPAGDSGTAGPDRSKPAPSAETVSAPQAEPETVVVEEPQQEPSPPKSEQPVETSVRVRRAKLYFVSIGEDSSITLSDVVRPVSFTDSPLTDTLNSLLKGLSSSEISRGMLSLVPEGTVLRSVVVRGDTAFVDFNESFRFNTFGREGYRYQLQQIVYTATEFQTVKRVQILIDGERLSYLGPESPYVGDPLSRDSLS